MSRLLMCVCVLCLMQASAIAQGKPTALPPRVPNLQAPSQPPLNNNNLSSPNRGVDVAPNDCGCSGYACLDNKRCVCESNRPMCR